MAHTGHYSHTGAQGSSHTDRTSKSGYGTGTSENIWYCPSHRGRGGTWKSKFLWKSDWELGKAAVISWMNSPGHRANLLDPQWHDTGIGVARNKRGTYYLTQNFGDAGAANLRYVPWWAYVLWWVVAIAVPLLALLAQ